MNVQISDAGVALIQASTGPITLTAFKLGDAYGYIPSPTDTGLHGAQVAAGVPSEPFAVNGNVVKYSIYLDYNLGDFGFGEFCLFAGNVMFANGTASALIQKIAAGLTVGNSIRIDIYLSMVGTNYAMWFDLAESNNSFRVAVLQTPDVLPPAAAATPNMYIIHGATSQQSPLLAYTDRDGLWAFDVYQYNTILSATVVGFDSFSVTIAISDFSQNMVPSYFGELIIEFTTGQLYSICRYVKNTIVSGNTATLSFDTPLAITPVVGDVFKMFTRATVSIELQIPIATASVLGGIKIGAGLLVAPDGTCSVDAHAIGLVTSVNNQVGDILINAANLPGLSTVGKTGFYSDLIGAPAQYVLPTMSTSIRGGAKLPSNGNLIITGTEVLDLGFVPVKTVNAIMPDASGNVTVTSTYILPTATASVLGGIKVGSGLSIAGDGTLSVVPYTLPAATGGTLGGIKVGAGLAIDGAGVLSASYALPTASASVLGGIKVGTGLSIDGAGVLNAVSTYVLPTASSLVLGGIKIGSGLNIDGSGVVSASVRTVNGVSPDGSGNVTITLPPDVTKLDRVNGTATGIRFAIVPLGSVSGGSLPIVQSAGNVQNVVFTGGAVTWSLSGWPSSGTYAEVQMKLTNGGLSTHTFPASVRFINPDGTLTASLATVLTNQRGITNFQTASVDFLIFFTDDGGTTVYCKIM